MLYCFYYLFVGKGHKFFPRGPDTPLSSAKCLKETLVMSLLRIYRRRLQVVSRNLLLNPPKTRRKNNYYNYTTNVFIYLVFKIILNLLYPESCCKYTTGQVYIYMYDICVFVRHPYILYLNRHMSYSPEL